MTLPLIDRRKLLIAAGAATAVAALGTRRSFAAILADRRLRLFNIHTGESLNRIYATPEGYDPVVLREVHHVLRDFRTNEVHAIEPALLDLVHDLSVQLAAQSPFDVISGYRSPATNAKLAAASSGVAKKSYHMKGMAIDIALPGRDLSALYSAARVLRRGGVGLYSATGFVHVDVGPVRTW